MSTSMDHPAPARSWWIAECHVIAVDLAVWAAVRSQTWCRGKLRNALVRVFKRSALVGLEELN